MSWCSKLKCCARGSLDVTDTPARESVTDVKMSLSYTNEIALGVSEIVQTEEDREKRDGERKGGVMVSVIDSKQVTEDTKYDVIQKDERSFNLLKKALLGNDFIKNLLDDSRLKAVIEAMQPKEYVANSYIIREGETGSHLYVSDAGKFHVIKNGLIVKTFGPGEAFGELAVLYKAKRFASIIASTDSKIWLLERKVFQKIMVRSGKQEQEDNINFLSKVPDLKGIGKPDLFKISGFLKREFFMAGTAIVRQGDVGDKFYIIRGGTVVVNKTSPGGGVDQFVKELTSGDYFGEQALLRDDNRLATVTAKAPGVECLSLERGPFKEYLGEIEELKNKTYTERTSITTIQKLNEFTRKYAHIELQDLKIIGTMGVGAFGRVELVLHEKTNETYALKCLKKVDVLLQQQQKHAFNEKNIMFKCSSPFLCKLYKTFKDNKYLYFLMEPILGGDVWTILQRHKYFDERIARFMAACVVEAFEHLHGYDIVYRDLKPENLMLDYRGYVKLVDFGYAKYLYTDFKTFTFAGTPEYVAPEIIYGTGHDRAVDYWALGILIHELLVGKPPFRSSNDINTYNMIIRGIDVLEMNSRISKAAQLLIKKLCRQIPAERLGYLKRGIKDIKNHKWFLGFDWNSLKDQNMKAPLVVNIHGNQDLTNFDKYERGAMPADENSGWDIDF